MSTVIANDEFNIRILYHATEWFCDYERYHLLPELHAVPFRFLKCLPGWRSYFNERTEGFFVFVPVVPSTNGLHEHIRNEMKHHNWRMAPDIYPSVQNFSEGLDFKDETNLFELIQGGYYPTAKDLKQTDLHEKSMVITCSASEWDIPKE